MAEQKQEDTALAIRQAMAVSEHGIELRTLEDAWRFAQMVASSGMAPKSLNTADKVLVAVQTGMEAGLTPMQAVRSVYVVNGVGAWMGEAAVALIRASGKCEWWAGAEIQGEDDARVAIIRSKRTDDRTVYETKFSVQDAKDAKLWEKSGPWTEYPERMLKWRAVGFHAKDHYSDVLRGLAIAEEVMDHPARDERRIVDVTPPPAKPDPLLEDAPGDAAPEEPMAPGEMVDGDAPPEVDPETGEVIPDHVGQHQDESPEGGQGELL